MYVTLVFSSFLIISLCQPVTERSVLELQTQILASILLRILHNNHNNQQMFWYVIRRDDKMDPGTMKTLCDAESRYSIQFVTTTEPHRPMSICASQHRVCFCFRCLSLPRNLKSSSLGFAEKYSNLNHSIQSDTYNSK